MIYEPVCCKRKGSCLLQEGLRPPRHMECLLFLIGSFKASLHWNGFVRTVTTFLFHPLLGIPEGVLPLAYPWLPMVWPCHTDPFISVVFATSDSSREYCFLGFLAQFSDYIYVGSKLFLGILQS